MNRKKKTYVPKERMSKRKNDGKNERNKEQPEQGKT